MIQAKLGDIVRVHYTGKLEDGSVFDSSEDCECGCDSGPLEFKIGEGQVIRGFENGVIGMAVGERKTVNIPVAEGYGERLEEMVAVIERTDIPQDLDPEVGQQMEVTLQDGQSIPVLVTDVTETTVTLDANHPLAGKDLIFDIELVEIG